MNAARSAGKSAGESPRIRFDLPPLRRLARRFAPAVLCWVRWREIGEHYGMGLTQAMLAHAIEAGRIKRQPIAPLAHVLLGALRESALYLASAGNRAQARREVGAVIDRLIQSLSKG